MKQIAWLLEPACEGFFCAPCGTQFAVRERRLYAEEHAELIHVLWHLGRGSRAEPLGDDGLRPGEWLLWRIDDPGNRYELERFTSQASARCLAQRLEARAHKQSYGVERQAARPRPSDDAWVLIRQDDGGMRYAMHRSASGAVLEDLAELLNRQPRHKQVYFVEPISERAPAHQR